MKIKLIITLCLFASFSCTSPYLEDNIEFTSSNSITASASFYININPYCCERRGLDSADVINQALASYGRTIEFTIIPFPDRTDESKMRTFTLDLLDNTQDLGGEHRYDNCETLISQSEVLTIGQWEIHYSARNELGELETRIKPFIVQTENPSQNCFRIF